MFKEVQDHLKMLLKAGIITESESPWSSAVVLVRKKNGALRFCVDYRQLNLRTVRDSYALPRIEESLDLLSGSKYFSCLDLRSGYYQVELEEQHKARTAFTVGHLGFYQFNRMPFGLTNAPATFQRLMTKLMGDLHSKECLVFIDDVIVYGSSFEEELQRLERVFQKFEDSGLKLNSSKCCFFKKKIKYLGHVVSEDGIETDPEKIEKVEQWPLPKNVDDVRQFLGFAGYYRRFVKDFSKLAKPMNDLLAGTPGKKQDRKKRGRSYDQPWKWTSVEDASFKELRNRLITAPILAYPNYSEPFVLYTDACGEGLGAVLSQKQDGVERVISYASKGLSTSERNYPAHKLEFLALKWAVTEKFHDFLYGHSFDVFTDNNPLTYVLESAKLDATGHRWVAALSSYDFGITYRSGKMNINADALSRLPKTLSPAVVNAVCTITESQPAINTMCMSSQVIEEFLHHSLPQMTVHDWREAQRNDPVIGPLLTYVTRKYKPNSKQVPDYPEAGKLLREFEKLVLRRGVLYRKIHQEGKERFQLVLPRSFRQQALAGLHDDVGHMGIERTLNLVRDRYYWPNMANDVEAKIKNCPRCLRRKGPANARAPLVNITTSQPMEMVCIDFLTLDMSKGGYQYVLVITDHFTRYAQAIPTKNMSAKTTAEALFQYFIVHYGFPERLHSDQGANFQSRLIKELCTLANVKKTRTSPYHPMGNGMCERFNRTLMNMLGTLEAEKKHNWKDHIRAMTYAYNATKHSSTGYSPFHLMFGREARLPIDTILGLEEEKEETSYLKYIESMKESLQEAFRVASESAKKSRLEQKTQYDHKVIGATVSVGDIVLVKKLAFEGRHKLEDRWEEEAYEVVKQPDTEIPVFCVRKQDGSGKVRTLHRNHLLPIAAEKEEEEEQVVVSILLDEKNQESETEPTAAEANQTEEEPEHSQEDIPVVEHSSEIDELEALEEAPTETDPVEDTEAVAEDDHSSDHSVDAEERVTAEDAEMMAEDDQSSDHPGDAEEPVLADVEVAPKKKTRPSRERRPPEFWRFGEPVAHSNQEAPADPSHPPGWRQKADFINSLVRDQNLCAMPDSIREAILQAVLEK